MCQYHDQTLVLTNRGRVVKVDTCIRALVQFLNDAGIMTYDSCCGHKAGYGHITIGEEDTAKARAFGFRICTDGRGHRAVYPFAAVDHRVNIILPPSIEREPVLEYHKEGQNANCV